MISHSITKRATLCMGLALFATIFSASPVKAQMVNNILWGPTGTDNYNTGANWPQFGAVPQADSFNEVAVINNGGTAFLSAPAVNSPGGLLLGTSDAMGGTLEIRDGGSLTLVDNGVTNGNAIIGAGAQAGTLIVQRGGSLTADILSSNPGDSSVTIGGGPGAGMANVTTLSSFFRTDTRIIGPNVNYNTNQLQLGGQSNIIAEITGATHSPIKVSGFAQLNGALSLEFNGVTPVAGNSWTILDAVGYAADFAQVTSTTPLGPGLAIATERTAGGNGTLLKASVEEVLTLKVNRQTGAASIVNQSGLPIGMSGYDINSPGGSLSTAWNSLADQSTAGFQEANPTVNHLAELDPIGPTNVSVSGFSLGNTYTPTVPAFGAALDENIAFRFQRDDGRDLRGIVEFEGTAFANNMVLTIDPETGNARLKNESQTGLNIDVYTVTSESSSLLTSWDSLQDNSVGNWQEANPSTAHIGELEPTGLLALAAGASFDLDGLWNTGGPQDVEDLTFTFRDSVFGELEGIVRFGTLLAGLDGDYNDDGTVDAADYTVWRDGDSPDSTVAGYNLWRANYGATLSPTAGPTAGAATAPEPAGFALLLLAIGAVLFAGRRAGERRLQSAVAVAHGVSALPTSQTSYRSWKMTNRLALLALIAAMTPAVADAVPVKITGATITDRAVPYTDGSITVSPFGPGGVPVAFGPVADFLGPLGGSNDNALDDVDGNPLTTADQERLDVTLAVGVGLTQFEYNFSRASPILVTGFSADPLASFGVNPGNSGSLAFDSGSNVLAIFQNYSTTASQINFGNSIATDGQTLSFTVSDYNQTGPQLAFSSFTYDTPVTLLAGDVDGLDGVTLVDFGIIRDNFRLGTIRSEGDLTGDGRVTLADFSQWEANYLGESAGLAALLTAPEPSSLVLMGIGSLGLARRRRCR